MEDNIANALQMAGAVLLFVIGLSIAILSFSQARQALDTVVAFSDRESLTIENDPRFYYLANTNTNKRFVGKETIIPTIYRAYKENFKIVFEFPDGYYLFKQQVKNSETNILETKEINIIDLEKQTIASDLASRQFLEGIIYGKFDYEPGKTLSDYKEKFKIEPNSKPLYDFLTDNEATYEIEESLGTYYMQDLITQEEQGGTTEETEGTEDESIQEVNKTEKRVITYTFKRM